MTEILTSYEPSNAERHTVIEPDWTKKDYKYVCENDDLKSNKIQYIFLNINWIFMKVRGKKKLEDTKWVIQCLTSKSTQEKAQKDKQWSTKHYIENYKSNPTKTGGEPGVP